MDRFGSKTVQAAGVGSFSVYVFGRFIFTFLCSFTSFFSVFVFPVRLCLSPLRFRLSASRTAGAALQAGSSLKLGALGAA